MTNRTLCLVALFIPFVSVGAQYPTSPPLPAPVKPAQFPPFQEATLPNGVRLVVVENHKAPVVSISLSMAAGGIYDPTGKEGLASIVAGLLTKGGGARGADQISEAIESVGGSLFAGANLDFTTVRANALTSSAPLAFELVGDAVARPTFPDKELELLRTQTLSGLQLELSDPAAIASATFSRAVYGTGPYAKRAKPTTVQTITRDDVVAFHKARLRPSGALLVVAGDITLAKATELATRALTGWTGAPTGTVAMTPPAAHANQEILLVHRPGSVQSNIYTGGPTFLPTDAQSYPLRIASRILGGGPQSRLFLIVREQKSYAYDAHTETARPKGVGTFRAVTQVRTEVTDSALAEVLAQVRRIQSEPVPAKELDDAKNSLVGQFPLTIQTADDVAQAVTDAKLLGLPATYLQTYRTRLAAVTGPEVMAAAKRVMGPAVIVVVGDATKTYEKLKKIAPVTLLTVDGTPMSPSELEVKASAIAVDPAKLRLGVDSFDVVLTQGGQSRSVGYQRSELAKRGNDFVYTEAVSIPLAGLQQNSTITFAPSLALKEIKQNGSVQGQTLTTSLTFSGNRVKGSAMAPQAGGPKTTAVDTTFAPGTIDGSQLVAILHGMDLADGFKMTVNAFDSGSGTTETNTVRVTGRETATVPAGTFEAYRVEVAGKQTVNILVTVAAPHRIVKIMPPGAPLEIRLVK
ncbi:MAG: pitrilysin family protein [bacterium]